ncbi:hypothetical protein JCM19233_159 [Vibrio astriarenae]|nr:hypothetical protein JCM19233_159 [Vibrio sp. C7]
MVNHTIWTVILGLPPSFSLDTNNEVSVVTSTKLIIILSVD